MSGDVHTVCEEEGSSKEQPCANAGHDCGIPSQRVGMNILEPPGKTPSGNHYVWVMTDYLTRWTAAFPLVNWRQKCIAYFCAPDYLHSDQSRSFEALLVLEMCRLLSIRKTRSSPYCPQGNGQAESFNRTLLEMLSIMCDGKPRQWGDMLPFVTLAYNSSVHARAGVTTAIAMLGRETGTRMGEKPKGYRTTFAIPENASIVCICWRGRKTQDAETSIKVLARQPCQGVMLLPERPRAAAMLKRGQLDCDWGSHTWKSKQWGSRRKACAIMSGSGVHW
ncbi:putative integrase core domain protein [Trichinella spiralis]|uniref:putative integrase core domain protein n=1 Tax=Trichinella spiralis TaxID=6334 RepID=UPI0001EFE77A|nr:putative integrase core domain protein [Trichinella spiralis]